MKGIEGQTPPTQIFALQDIYQNTNGQSWTNNANWNVGDPCDNSWFGVSCDNYNVSRMFVFFYIFN